MKGYLRWFNQVDEPRRNSHDDIRAELMRVKTDGFENSRIAAHLHEWQNEDQNYASVTFRAVFHSKEVRFSLYTDYDGIHVEVGGARINSTNPYYVQNMATLAMRLEDSFRTLHADVVETPPYLKFYDFRPYSYLAKVTDKLDGSFILQVSDNIQQGRTNSANLPAFHFSRKSETRRYAAYDKTTIFWDAATLMAEKQGVPYWSAFPILRHVFESPQTNTKLLLMEVTRAMTYQYMEIDENSYLTANNEAIRI